VRGLKTKYRQHQELALNANSVLKAQRRCGNYRTGPQGKRRRKLRGKKDKPKKDGLQERGAKKGDQRSENGKPPFGSYLKRTTSFHTRKSGQLKRDCKGRENRATCRATWRIVKKYAEPQFLERN